MKFNALKKLLLLLMLTLTALPGLAHNRSESFSEWSGRDGSISYVFSVLNSEVKSIAAQSKPSLKQPLTMYLASRISVSQVDSQGRLQLCRVITPPSSLPANGGYIRVEGRFQCEQNTAPRITIKSFFEVSSDHIHYAKLRSHNNLQEALVAEFLFTKSQTTHTLINSLEPQNTSNSWQAFNKYLWIGASHIMGGLDHLAFLLGLILLASSWRQIAWLISGFTLGHSLSLALAVLNVATPNATMVEALIGFTIMLVVMEAVGERCNKLPLMAHMIFCICMAMTIPVWWLSQRMDFVMGMMGAGLFALCYMRLLQQLEKRVFIRLVVTVIFGLIHGFGFAGGLLEIGFPAGQLALVLLGFNLGVELGQLLILILVLILFKFVRQFASANSLTSAYSLLVTILGAVGSYWFIARLMM